MVKWKKACDHSSSCLFMFPCNNNYIDTYTHGQKFGTIQSGRGWRDSSSFIFYIITIAVLMVYYSIIPFCFGIAFPCTRLSSLMLMQMSVYNSAPILSKWKSWFKATAIDKTNDLCGYRHRPCNSQEVSIQLCLNEVLSTSHYVLRHRY